MNVTNLKYRNSAQKSSLKLDFAEINRAALSASGYIQRLLPRARQQGNELICGDVFGNPGDSFQFNLAKGVGADFATGEIVDIIGILAAQKGVSQAEAARLIADELRPSRKSKELPFAPTSGYPTKIYSYFDENGTEVYQVGRWELPGHRKSVRPGQTTSAGVFTKGMGVAKQTLYNLPNIINADAVIIAEGENKVDELKSLGLCATCNTGGAGKWKDEYSKYLSGKHVSILPDNDGPGIAHANQVAASVKPVAASVKVVMLPGLPEKGDIVDWLETQENNKETLLSLISAAPIWEPQADISAQQETQLAVVEDDAESRPLNIDWTQYGGVQYITRYPEPFQYLLRHAFLKGELGIIFGPPGCGKGTFALQMAAFVAASLPVFGWWEVPEPINVLFISAEDSLAVIHRRIFHAIMMLPEKYRYDAAARIVAIPVRGRVSICQGEHNCRISLTQHFYDLRKIIEEFRPGLVILDTLSRFLGIDENDNAAMTAACGLLEEIISDFGCNIVVLHHVSKASGDCADSEFALSKALSQMALRGASSISGAVRFEIALAPVGKKLATDFFGDIAKECPAGSFVIARTAKKNVGAPEPYFCLQRGDNGLLERIEKIEDAKSKEAESDAKALAAEVARRASSGENPLSVSKGGVTAFQWGISRSKKAAQKAIVDGLLASVAVGTNRHVLTLPHGSADGSGSMVPHGSDEGGTIKKVREYNMLPYGSGLDGSEGVEP
jgi:RecA-family ATPase